MHTWRLSRWAQAGLVLIVGLGLVGLPVGRASARSALTYTYAPDDVIVIAAVSEVTTAEVNINSELGTGLDCASTAIRIDLAWISATGLALDLFPVRVTTDPLQICIYSLPDEASADLVISRFNQFFNRIPGQIPTGYAHRNYPVGASPHAVEGSPKGMGGLATLGDFNQQSAWNAIELYHNGQRTITQTGANATTVILDTAFPANTLLPASLNLTILPPAAALSTWYPPETYICPQAGTPLTNCQTIVPQPIPGHAAAIASLIHQVAPDTALVSIPVLNDMGFAELSGVLSGINHAIAVTQVNGRLDRVIFNLSWGVRTLPGTNSSSQDFRDVAALYTLLQAARELGANLVASAGNGSTMALQPPDSPANFPFVISVAATHADHNANVAFYSNLSAGNGVYAPGGQGGSGFVRDGVTFPPLDPAIPCSPQACLVGWEPDSATTTQYRYWIGTSFSAPLVTGLVALLKEHAPQWTPEQVHMRVKLSAEPATGVINVCRALGGNGCRFPEPNQLILNCSKVVYTGQNFGSSLPANLQTAGVYGLETTLRSTPSAPLQPVSAALFSPANPDPLFPSPGALVGRNALTASGQWSLAAALQAPQNAFAPLPLRRSFATLQYHAAQAGIVFTDLVATTFSDRDGFPLLGNGYGCWTVILPAGHLDGQVTYQGRLVHTGIQVGLTGASNTVTTSSNGQYTLGPILAASSIIRAYAPKYLPACIPTQVPADMTTPLPPARLLGGNLVNTAGGVSAPDADGGADNDRVINIGDLTRLTASFGLNDPGADINADGVVNIQDLAILGGNYGRQGCQDWIE